VLFLEKSSGYIGTPFLGGGKDKNQIISGASIFFMPSTGKQKMNGARPLMKFAEPEEGLTLKAP